MRKPVLYSPSQRPPDPALPIEAAQSEPPLDLPEPTPGRLTLLARNPRAVWAALFLLTGLLLLSLWQGHQPVPRTITQQDIDAAVLRTLSTQSLPSAIARAAEKIRPSVVRVTSLEKVGKGDEEEETSVGTGVVIVDKGVILTNLHVVQGAKILRIRFADGSESDAAITGVQPEHDLAVLQARTVPDDLKAATLRSSHDLLPGETVVAVGFPFGIGPSVSAGVVSGLNRSFKSPEGEQEIANLIQFDAAANPGNSGGPLVALDGEVVGIVTGILNPTSHRTFAGIGFAVPIEGAASAAGMPPF